MLEGRVALITGAGRGLGREHALLFAELGARVVVNDVGGAGDGSGGDTSPAEAVAAEIRAAGGAAIASTESVTAFAAAGEMVRRTVDTFGDLDIVVNNAGILRDRMLVSMSADEFDDVIAVHLKGTFNVTRHAAGYWRQRSKVAGARPRAIVNTSSGAGLHGNLGQTNYAAAKAGVAAMTLVHARELGRYGVRVNGIAPIARTRLTDQTPGLSERVAGTSWEPGDVSPLVAYLASAGCPFTGQMFSVYGGTVGIYSGWSTAAEIHQDGRWTPGHLKKAMEEQLPREGPSVNPFLAAVRAKRS